MATVTGKLDDRLGAIKAILDDYEHTNPGSEATIYRQNSVSVRIRIIDPAYDGLDKPERHEKAWEFLGKLPEDAQQNISMLVLLAPEEGGKSFANSMFEQREPSRL